MNHFRLAKGTSFELLDLISLINKRGVNKGCMYLPLTKHFCPDTLLTERFISLHFLCTQNLSSYSKRKGS